MHYAFVDTAAWIALINLNDRFHSQSKQVMSDLQRQRTQLITTDFVFIEVADALSAIGIRQKTVTYINGLRNLNILEVEPFNNTLFNEGWDLYGQRPDKEWTLTDCISIAFMKRKNVTLAFTSDHHFEQAGLVKLL